MALRVKDLLHLQSMQGMKLIAGINGLERVVCSAGIADYEFVPEVDYHNQTPFEKDSFVLSTLLFAQCDPDRILRAVKELYEIGIAGFAYKTVIYKTLPKEVTDFAEAHDFPIFAFGDDLYFENVIYEVMDTVQKDDKEILSEANLKLMIEHEMTKEEVVRIAKSVSLLFKPYAMAVYLKPKTPEKKLDMGRIMRNFYLNKTLKSKSVLCRYNNGIFLILTGAYNEDEKFDIILEDVLEGLSVNGEALYLCRSGIYSPYEGLDCCLRESYHTYAASVCARKSFSRYEEIGAFKYLVPLRESYFLYRFSENLIRPLMDKDEFLHTAILLVINNGDIGVTASDCSCHQNTIRYRLGKIKEMIGCEDKTEPEFYAELSAAIRIYLLRKAAVL